MLAYVYVHGLVSASDVAEWLECSAGVATRKLSSLQRRGLVVHSGLVARWSATPRAERVLSGTDGRGS